MRCLVQENKVVSNAFNGLSSLWSDAEYEGIIQRTLKMECNILICYLKNLLYYIEWLTKQNEKHLFPNYSFYISFITHSIALFAHLLGKCHSSAYVESEASLTDLMLEK